MTQVTIEEAQSRLGELIAGIVPGDEIQILKADRVVAKLVPVVPNDEPCPRFGSARGSILSMADDFDAPLEDFKEYME